MPRPNVSEQRREQILAAAAHALSVSGFESVRMSDIAAAAGLSQATLYLYFEHKEAIYDALLDSVFGREQVELRALIDSAEPSASRLSSFLEQLLDDFEAMGTAVGVVYEFYALAVRDAARRERLAAYFDSYRQVLSQLIEQGIERGEFRRVPAATTAVTLMALFEGTALLAAINPAAVPLRAQVRAGFAALIRGLEADPTGS